MRNLGLFLINQLPEIDRNIFAKFPLIGRK